METQINTSPAVNSRKEASTPLRILAAFFAILFVIFALIGLIGFDIWRVFFNPTLVKEILTDEVVSSRIVPAILESYSEQRAQQRIDQGEALSGITEPDIALLISYIDADKWQEIKQFLLTEEFLTNLVSVSVDGIYQWIDSTDPLPSILWDMMPLKDRLQGEQGKQAILIAYSAMPVCTEEDIADFKQRESEMPPGVEILYNLCQFPDPWREDQVSDYLNALGVVNQNFPTQVRFQDVISDSTPSEFENPETLKTQLRLVRSIAQWSWLVPLFLLLIIAALAVRTLRSLGLFVGIPFTLTGLLTLLTALIARSAITSLISASLLNSTAPLLRQEIENTLGHLTAEIFIPMLIEGIIFLVIGIGLIILMIVRKPKTTRSA